MAISRGTVFFSAVLFSINAGCTVKTTDRGTDKEPPVSAIVKKESGQLTVDQIEEVESTAKQDLTGKTNKTGSSFSAEQLNAFCNRKLGMFPGKFDADLMKSVCKDVQILDSCVSRKGQPIFHYDRPSIKKNAERILTFAVTHGDEFASGSVARSWANRLSRINPRNEWRIVPILNPDGLDNKTRMNGAGVDINRNYPSADWDEKALTWWKSKKKSDPRRYPGPTAGSEPETVCSIDHINDFQPDLIISVHTPLGVLDFDGPRLNFPSFSNLPWISLGTYPGSLGRYMWHDRKVPVLTIELKNNIRQALDKFDRLQDISGQVAMTISQDEKRKSQEKSKQ